MRRWARTTEVSNGWLLDVGVPSLLVLLVSLQSIAWAPHYLTWPWNCDIEIFANQAQAWTVGRLPYRDTPQNNFPGQMYAHLVLGKLFGWGKPWVFWTFDIGLLAGVVGLALRWSRRMFGRFLPGLAAATGLLGLQFTLSGLMIGQRDGQGACFLLMALLITQSRPGRLGLVLAAALTAIGFVFRPQTILFWPGLVACLDGVIRAPGEPIRRSVAATIALAGLTLVFIGLLFLPLVLAGVWGDFLRGLAVTMPGGSYGSFDLPRVVRQYLNGLADFPRMAIVVAILAKTWRASPERQRLALPWIVTIIALTFYQAISPHGHEYSSIPLRMTIALASGLAAGLILEDRPLRSVDKLLLIVLLLALQTTFYPRYCSYGGTLTALRSWNATQPTTAMPPGAHESMNTIWADYARMVVYLKETTRPDEEIANFLKSAGMPVNAPTGRISPFPSSSVGWLSVNPKALDDFLKPLQTKTNVVVVWNPTDPTPMTVWKPSAFGGVAVIDERPIVATIERFYQRDVRFGPFEVWRRKP